MESGGLDFPHDTILSCPRFLNQSQFRAISERLPDHTKPVEIPEPLCLEPLVGGETDRLTWNVALHLDPAPFLPGLHPTIPSQFVPFN